VYSSRYNKDKECNRKGETMSAYEELDVIRISKDNEKAGIKKGMNGTIVLVHNEEDYEIEIPDKDGTPHFLGTLSKEYFTTES